MTVDPARSPEPGFRLLRRRADSERRSIWDEVRAVTRSVRPGVWLGMAMAVYFAVSLTYSLLRVVELQTTTWDLGIYQQAIWSTSHGRPFYEAADLETGGFGTFLQVHSVYVLYGVVPLYAVWPSETLLLGIQSAVVALAAVPLYLLGREVVGSSWWGLAGAGLYLAWAPTLASNLYDFHIEAFLPLEIFAFVLLWQRGRYGWGFGVALVAFATMELTPVLLFFVGLFYLIPTSGAIRHALRELRETRALPAWLAKGARTFLARSRWVASAGLLGVCVAAYYLNLLLRERYLAPLLGVPAFPTFNSGYVIGGTFGELGLLGQNLADGFLVKVLAWGLLLALLGFVPLLAPRALVLAVPWLAFTFFSANPNYVTLGFQYGFIEAAALLVAFVFGMPALAGRLRPRPAPLGDADPPSEAPSGSGGPGSPIRPAPARPRPWGSVLAIAFAVLLAVNVAASPLDPWLQRSDGLGSAYGVSLAVPAGFATVQMLAGLVPPQASVLASDNLFPLVANSVHAYSFFWQANDRLYLPFNATQLPQFVFLSQDRTDAVPAWLTADLYNSSDYGLRGISWSTAVGPVLLFESGFHGAPAQYSVPSRATQEYTGAGLDPQAAGRLVQTGDPQYPVAVESVPEVSGPIWSAPYGNLPVGNYTVTLGLSAHAASPGGPPAPGTSTLFVNSNAFGQPVWFQGFLNFSTLAQPTWVAVTFSVVVTQPAIEVEVRGYLSDPAATVELAYLEISPTP